MEIPVGPFLRRIHIARIHVCEGGFSYPLLPLFQQRSAIMISAVFFFFFFFFFCLDSAGFCAFWGWGGDAPEGGALGAAWANQTHPWEMR